MLPEFYLYSYNVRVYRTNGDSVPEERKLGIPARPGATELCSQSPQRNTGSLRLEGELVMIRSSHDLSPCRARVGASC